MVSAVVRARHGVYQITLLIIGPRSGSLTNQNSRMFEYIVMDTTQTGGKERAVYSMSTILDSPSLQKLTALL